MGICVADRMDQVRSKAPPPTVGSCWIESKNAPNMQDTANSGWWTLPAIALGAAVWVIVLWVLTLSFE
jgi:hypothetical protein